ncbi:MAG: prepilin peptidase [Deltaproteobacteria bacterium]|nr:prepilin peptidase [Deltaproteobacteria bacterium]
MPAVEQFLAMFACVWGAVWGSFLNVVIYRLPRGESLLTPPSHCPHCQARIRWFHNIPVASYVLLGGRCASCRAPISVRYPLVELTAACLSLAAWFTAAYNPLVPDVATALALYAFLFLFVMALVAITFIDLEHLIIPDSISLPGIPVALTFAALQGQYLDSGLVSGLIGAAAGAGLVAFVIGAYWLVTKQVGMGWGDAKLMAVIGGFLGWRSLFFIFLAGSIQGLVYAGLMLAVTRGRPAPAPGDEVPPDSLRKVKIPFGPFLAIGALEWLFFSRLIESCFSALFGM